MTWKGFWILAAGVVASLLFLPAQARAMCDDWQRSDTILGTLMTVAMVSDWNQTRQIASAPERTYRPDGSYTEGTYETNPTLGRHPKPATVNLWFASGLAAQWTGACLLTGDARTVWFTVWIVTETLYVNHNTALGIHVRF